jgi:ElaB/YqjD/DUF883 family membrane-anchored ribosome-binding protein
VSTITLSCGPLFIKEGGEFAMNGTAFARAGEQVVDNITEFAEKARDISERVKEQWGDTYHDFRKGARRARVAAQEGIDEARKQIKAKPLRSVGVVAGVAFTFGLLTGVVIGRRR